MRTKTLLIAAAALVAGIISSNAQVYSANVVGYVNVALTNGVLNAISPTLDVDGSGTNNTIATVVGTNNIPLNSTIYVYTGSGYDTVIYSKSGHSPNFVTNWYLGVTITNNYPLNPGVGFFIIPGGNFTNVQVGTVLQGSLTNSKVPSVGGTLGLVSSQVPLSGGITTTLNYQPQVNDTVYLYSGGGYQTYIYSKAGHSPNFVTNWYYGVTISEPQINVGQAFWLKPANSGSVWTNNFIVH
jgi:hypothetical protein